MASAVLESIWIKRFKRGPMDPAREAQLVAGRGIVGNANQGGKRQVTIISREAWDAVTRELGAEVPPQTRRANLLVSGVELANTRGRVLRVGECRVRVYGETKPCWQMEEAHAGLQSALRPDWRGGAFAEVLDDGRIAVGDSVEWIEED
ncbi:MAG: MOSC domain-containing protein [Gemmatimonadota bacterium]|nr:MOSC domain-containing protein [Gemmatimonadota bacterium]